MKKAIGFIAVLVIFLTNCGSSSSTSSSTTTAQVSVAISPSTQQSIDQGQAVNFTATVTNDSNSDGVSWTLSGTSCTGAACGTLTNTSTTAATYTAPASVSATLTVTVKATSVKDSGVSKSVTVVVAAAPAVTTTSLPDGTVGTAYSQTLAASGGTGSLSWSITTGTLPNGLALDAGTGVISGTPTGSGKSDFTVQVTDSAATPLSATKALSITVANQAMVITTTSLSAGTVGVAYTATLQADYATQPVVWSISTGTLPNGLALDANTGVISGTPTATGSSSFTVMATDSSTPAQTATQPLSITIGAAGANNSIMTGHYAFLLSGYDTSGNRVAVAGTILADGSGAITDGVQDTNDTGSAPLQDLSITGTYSIGADNRGTITITNSHAITYTMAVAMGTLSSGVAAKGSILEFDASGFTMSGVIELQDSTAFSASAVSGSYAFGLTGSDHAGARSAFVGEFAADGSGGITGGSFDANDSGTDTASAAITASAYSISTSTGRVAATLTGLSTADYAFYVVSADKFLAISVDDTASFGLYTGEVDKRTGPFSAASLNAADVLGLESEAVGGSDVSLGIATFDGSGNATLAADDNNAGVVTLLNNTAAYTTPDSTTGRFTLTPTGSSAAGLVGYLVAANQGFLLGTGDSVESGTFEKQSGGPFTDASLNTTAFYGTQPFAVTPVAPPSGGSAATLSIGVVSFDGAGNITGTSDDNELGTLNSDQSVTDTYSVAASGRVTLGSDVILYIVSPTKFVTMSINSGDPNPTLGFGRE